MINSGGDISDSLIMSRAQVRASSWMPPSAARIAWDEIDWDAYDMNPEPEPEKVGKIKRLLNCVGIGKNE